MTSSMIKN